MLRLTPDGDGRNADLQRLRKPVEHEQGGGNHPVRPTENVSCAYGAEKRVMPACWVNTSTAPSFATSTPTGLDPVRPKE